MRPHHLARSIHYRRIRSTSSIAIQLGRRIRNGVQSLTDALQKLTAVDHIDTSKTIRTDRTSSWRPSATYLPLIFRKSSSDSERTRSLKNETKQSLIQKYLSLAALSAGTGLRLFLAPRKSDAGHLTSEQSRSVSKTNSVDVISASASSSSPSSDSRDAPKSLVVTKAFLDSTTRNLFLAVTTAKSNMSRHLSVEELCKHLRKHPDAKGLADKIGGVRQLLLVQRLNKDPVVLEGLREALALLGHCNPPAGWGIRILSIDGGGLRGIMALEVLRRLEELTGRPVHTMFDYVCGVSTGAILTVLLGALKLSIVDCEKLYKQIGTAIFTQNPIWGAGKLVLSHAFYDTATWAKLIRENVGSKLLIETRREPNCPLIAAVSAVVNRPQLQAFTFRNYDHPARVQSQYPGTHTAHLWESIRASAAAPGYFEEYQLGQDVHQDGGILVNNPTALAIHECKHVWPNEQLQCVVSLGGGRYEPQPMRADQNRTEPSATGLKMKLMKIVDSATDTEAVHTTLHDLLPPTLYFRINPYITENIAINESRLEKIEQLQQDARMYLRRNDAKIKLAAEMLTQPRTRMQSLGHFLSEKSTEFFG